MIDRFGRVINYLRISVTDRCNLRCKYCMPPAGVVLVRHEDILSFEEIDEVTRQGVSMGISKVRLTGGEPLVRRGIVTLVEMLAGIEGIHDLAMTTNGTLLADFAEELAAAGLMRVNVSLDAMDADRFAAMTGGGEVGAVLAGIDAAVAAGVARERIIVDPGIGFGKRLEHNLALIAGIGELVELGRPVLIGPSRKRFIGELTGEQIAANRGAGTLAACLAAFRRGATIFRVHDVAPLRQALTVAAAVEESQRGGESRR